MYYQRVGRRSHKPPLSVELLRSRSRLEGSCWVWTGSRSGNYGTIQRKEGLFYVHRLMRALVDNVPYQALDCVRHSCDNPPCCNPDHLINGTCQDNMADMAAKGRHRGTLGRRFQKLTPADAQQIRDLYAQGQFTQLELARRFETSQPNVSAILSDRSHSAPSKQKLTAADADEIRQEYAKGAHTQKELADRYGTTRSNISAVLLNRTFHTSK